NMEFNNMSLVKKLTLSVAILAITTGSALAADATITVKGLLVPSGCSLGIIEGNTLDFGTQAVDQLTDASNNLPMIKESQLKVDCPTDMYVALRTNHLNAADESKVKTLSNGNPTIINTADGRTVDLTLGSSKNQINPLLRAGGKGAGAFWTVFRTPTITTVANPTPVEKVLIYSYSTDLDQPWTIVPKDSAGAVSLTNTRRISVAEPGKTSITPAKTVVFPLQTTVALLDKASFADVTGREEYTGGFEVFLEYK
ncbi:TPA: hypothetical protein ACIYHC_003160, partial [Escherichia coli]